MVNMSTCLLFDFPLEIETLSFNGVCGSFCWKYKQINGVNAFLNTGRKWEGCEPTVMMILAYDLCYDFLADSLSIIDAC